MSENKNKNIGVGIFSLLFSLGGIILVAVTVSKNSILFSWFADPFYLLSMLDPILIRGIIMSGILSGVAFLLGMLGVILGSLKDKNHKNVGLVLTRIGGIFGYVVLLLVLLWIAYIAIIGGFNSMILYEFLIAP